MNIIKATLLGLTMSISAIGFSQSFEETATAQTELMTTALNLSDAQIERVKILNLTVAEKIEAIQNNPSLSPEKKIEFIDGNKSDRKIVLKSILTEVQFNEFLAIEDQF